jgi:RNA polymerase sigma-70 factor (ECF subfamily)
MLDAYGKKLIAVMARKQVGKAGFTEADRPDIEQELAIDLFLRMRHYDPARGMRSTFMTCVVEREVARLIEARQTPRRSWQRRMHSLNAPIVDGEDSERIDALIDPMSLSAQEQMILQLDVSLALDSLPDDLRELGERLLEGPMAEVARELGLPRSTLYGRLDRLRKALSKAGLEDYL